MNSSRDEGVVYRSINRMFFIFLVVSMVITMSTVIKIIPLAFFSSCLITLVFGLLGHSAFSFVKKVTDLKKKINKNQKKLEEIDGLLELEDDLLEVHSSIEIQVGSFKFYRTDEIPLEFVRYMLLNKREALVGINEAKQLTYLKEPWFFNFWRTRILKLEPIKCISNEVMS